VIATDVDGVYRDWGGPAQARIEETTPAELRRQAFTAGSMGPKVEAACAFAEATGRPAVIGALDDLTLLLGGAAGTRVTPDSSHHRIGFARTPR
jgi:carbamate kinase